MERKKARPNLSYQFRAMERLIRPEGDSRWTYSSLLRHIISVTPPAVAQSTDILWRTLPPSWLHTGATRRSYMHPHSHTPPESPSMGNHPSTQLLPFRHT